MAYTVVDKNTAVRHIVIDADADLDSVSVNKFAPGTTVFSIDSSNTFMLSNALAWETVTVTAPTSTI